MIVEDATVVGTLTYHLTELCILDESFISTLQACDGFGIHYQV